MWWQFKKVYPSIKLHLCHCVDIQLFVRVDRYKKSTNVGLWGERMHTGGKAVPSLERWLPKEKSSSSGHGVRTMERDGTELVMREGKEKTKQKTSKKKKITKTPSTGFTISKPTPSYDLQNNICIPFSAQNALFYLLLNYFH